MFLSGSHHITIHQKTVRQVISILGIGLHTGKKVSMRILPAVEDSGIVFYRKDIRRENAVIPARWFNVIDTRNSTTIGNDFGVTVSTIEHIMASLSACGIDNAIIEVDGPEVPILDGSAKPFMTLLEQVGTVDLPAERRAICLRRPVEVHMGDRFAILIPDTRFRMTFEIDFPATAVGRQKHLFDAERHNFGRDIAPARAFGFADEISYLRNQGLARGGTLKNAILVDGMHIVNEDGLRFNNEFVRHKILDALGDIALAGAPIVGHLYAHKSGHRLNNALLHKLFELRDAWSFTTLDIARNTHRAGMATREETISGQRRAEA